MTSPQSTSTTMQSLKQLCNLAVQTGMEIEEGIKGCEGLRALVEEEYLLDVKDAIEGALLAAVEGTAKRNFVWKYI